MCHLWLRFYIGRLDVTQVFHLLFSPRITDCKRMGYLYASCWILYRPSIVATYFGLLLWLIIAVIFLRLHLHHFTKMFHCHIYFAVTLFHLQKPSSIDGGTIMPDCNRRSRVYDCTLRPAIFHNNCLCFSPLNDTWAPAMYQIGPHRKC